MMIAAVSRIIVMMAEVHALLTQAGAAAQQAGRRGCARGRPARDVVENNPADPGADRAPWAGGQSGGDGKVAHPVRHVAAVG
jgi:hypothetical protein